MDFSDHVILVTGGAHRLGKAIALAFARRGAHIAFTYLHSTTAAQTAQAEMEALGVTALGLSCDQADPEQIQAVVDQVRARFGRLDGLVNSAANFHELSFWEATPQAWDDILDVNTRGPFFFTQAAARMMLEGQGGAVINILDESALAPGRKYALHGLSKNALWMATRMSALALAPRVRVNAILAGPVLKPADWDDARWQGLNAHIPIGHPGSPEDVCQAALYLMSADFVTGSVLTVDGGSSLRFSEIA